MTCVTTEISMVRLMIGDLDATLVSDQVIQLTLSKYADKTSPTKEYLSALDSLQYAWFNQSKTGGRRRERKGPFEVEVYGTEVSKSLKAAYDHLLKNPPSGIPRAIGILIGGVSLEEYNRVRSDDDSLSPEPSIGWLSRDVGQDTAYKNYQYTDEDV